MRGIKKGHGRRRGSSGEDRRDWRESDSGGEGIRFTARSPGKQAKPAKPAIQPPWHSRRLSSPPLPSSRSRPHCARRTHRLCPANLPPFACFHSYERRRKGALVVCMCGKFADERVCVCVFFSLGNVGMDAREQGGRETRGTRKEKRGSGNGLERARTRSRFQCASERISRIFFGSDENAPYLRVRTAEMSHTTAINVDGSCSSLRRDPSAAQFRSE